MQNIKIFHQRLVLLVFTLYFFPIQDNAKQPLNFCYIPSKGDFFSCLSNAGLAKAYMDRGVDTELQHTAQLSGYD